MQPMLNIAIRAARAGAAIILRHLDRIDTLQVTEKSRNDFVSDVDRKAESAIIDTLLHSYPDHGILAEESGQTQRGDYQWIIDPLDGTSNYLHGFPQFAVSIALRHRERLLHAVILDPLRQELFTASDGGGAQLNGKRIRASRRRGIKGALLGTGFPFGDKIDDLGIYMKTLQAMIPHSAGIRRAGAAALDLAWVAAGRLDGFWEFGLSPWDMAAGALLVREAGGIVTDLNGRESFLANGNIVCGTPGVHRDLTRILDQLGSARQLDKLHAPQNTQTAGI